MSYRSYPAYKHSGVEWLGEVPEHWAVVPCRAAVQESKRKNDSGAETNYLSLMANIGIILYEEKGDVGNKKPEDLTKCKMVEVGDLVINSMNYGIGSYGISPYAGVCSPVYIILKPCKTLADREFAYRLFQHPTFQTVAQSFGNGILAHRAAISWDILKTLYIPLPPLAEQQAIAAFLDTQCARIDTLIERQNRLIELLQEKRQALITQAVTRGLNADVPLKHSGVEWLGQVPEHWGVKKLRTTTVSIETGPFGSQLHAEDYVQGAVPVINPSHLVDGRIVPDSSCTISVELASQLCRHKLAPGDIIVARRGELGRCALTTENEAGWLCGTGSMTVRLRSEYFSRYALILIACSLVRQWLELQSVGSTMSNLNASILGSLQLPVPPLAEQQAIVEYLDAECARIDKVVSHAQRSIELMQERRSALISAAVTGKIDVRGSSEQRSHRASV